MRNHIQIRREGVAQASRWLSVSRGAPSPHSNLILLSAKQAAGRRPDSQRDAGATFFRVFKQFLGCLVMMTGLFFANSSIIRAQPRACGNGEADKLLEQAFAITENNPLPPQAILLYDEAAKAAPECGVPYFYKGIALNAVNRYEEAIVAFQEALKRNFADAWRPNALICKDYYDLKKYKEAIASCREAIRLNDKFEPAYGQMGLAYSALGDMEAALVAMKSAIELDPNQYDTHILRANILYQLQRKSEAIPDLLAAVKLKPESFEALTLLGEIYYETKDYARAIEPLSQAVKLNKDNPSVWLVLSISYGATYDWPKAEAAAKEAARIVPNNGNVQYALGSMTLFTGDFEEGVKAFDAAIKNNNLLQVSAAVYKGYCYIGLRQKDKAQSSFEQALTLKPAAAVDYLVLSWVYSYRWELDKARDAIKKNIDFAPSDDDSFGYTLLSWNRILADDPQSAIIAANEAIQKNPKGGSGYSQRCRAYNELKLPDIAIKDCYQALEIDADDSEALFYLGRSYGLKKDRTDEKKYNRQSILSLEKTLGIVSGAPASATADKQRINITSPLYLEYLYLLGNAYIYDDNYPAAINIYENAVELRPKFPRLRYNLALCYLKLKRPDLKNAGLQYQALLTLDKTRAAELKKAIDGFR